MGCQLPVEQTAHRSQQKKDFAAAAAGLRRVAPKRHCSILPRAEEVLRILLSNNAHFKGASWHGDVPVPAHPSMPPCTGLGLRE